LDGKHPLGSVIPSSISIKIWYKSYRNVLQRDVASAKMNCSVRKESGLKKYGYTLWNGKGETLNLKKRESQILTLIKFKGKK
jgi:hypothetical protein